MILEQISVLMFLEGRKLQWIVHKQKFNHEFYDESNKKQRN